MPRKYVNYADEYAKKMASRAKWTAYYSGKRKPYIDNRGAVADPLKPGQGGAAK
jgi:hypothetical protein